MESSNDIELINSLGVEVVGVSCGLVPLSATSQPRRTWEFEWCAEWCAQFRHGGVAVSREELGPVVFCCDTLFLTLLN